MKLTLLLDMDGTIVATYNQKNWLEKLRNYDTSPYEKGEPMWDMEKLTLVLNELSEHDIEIKIVSWCSKESTADFTKRTRKAKKDWLKRYNFPYDSCRITPYGYPKEYFRNKQRLNILIDDNIEVRESFCRFENCIAIDPTKTDIIKYLQNLMG